MRFPRALASASVVACVVAGLSVATVPSAEAVAGATADFEMNEPVGSTRDDRQQRQRPQRRHRPDGRADRRVFDGATGYNWVRRPPEQAPPSPERVIQVPDNIDLEPGNEPFTIELRYRTQGELRQHHPEGPGADSRRAVEDPEPRGASRRACSRARSARSQQVPRRR